MRCVPKSFDTDFHLKMKTPRTLVLGLNEKIHRALAGLFNIVHIVADAETATEQWDDIYFFKRIMERPTFDALNDGSYQFVVARYQRYADINSRRYVTVNARESEIFNGFMAYFYWAHRLLKEKKIELVLFHNFPHESFDYVIYLLARYFGIRTIVLHQCFLMSDRFWISEEIEKFGDFSASPPISPKTMSGYTLPEQWYYMNDVSDKWVYTLRDLVMEVIRRPWRLPVAALRYHYNRDYRRLRSTTVTDFDESQRYIYLPLHMQPELTTSTMGGPDGRYGDQVQIVEQLSMMTPPGVKIYLKENPKQTAQQRDSLFYRRIAALPNVSFVSPGISSALLIKKSIAVATVTGTAGWESLFHGKPCLVFGNAWYSGFRGVTKFVPGLRFEEWMTNIPPSHEDLVEQLDELLTTTGEGVVDPLHAVVVPDFDPEINAQRIGASLMRYMQATSSPGQ